MVWEIRKLVGVSVKEQKELLHLALAQSNTKQTRIAAEKDWLFNYV